jgi:hypothetical protein
MILRLTRIALCGFMAATLGCQNPDQQSHKFADRDDFHASLSFASDDPAGLETGRGHLPSLASEMADQRRLEERTSGIPGGSHLTVQRLLERGHDADAHGRAQEARMYYEQVLAEDPKQPDAHHRLAILADRAGDFRQAEEHYRLALEGKPNNPDVLNDLGYSYFLQGRAADSERYLNQARQMDPRHPHVSENLSLLYDPAKAEKVLMSVMGPRQAQATLAQLFQNPPMMETHRAIAPVERGVNDADQRLTQSPDEPPKTLEALQRKMEEARMKSIAERHKRNSPGQNAALPDRNAGLPPLPVNYPQRVPAHAAAQIGEIPDGRINDAFRAIDDLDQSMRSAPPAFVQRPNASQVTPAAYEPRRLADARELAKDASPMMEQRVAAPQWSAPPQAWPAHSAQTVSAETIERASHVPVPPMYPPTNSHRPVLPSAARRAAEIGMAAGPGSLFPPMAEGYDSTELQKDPAPAARSLPGTNSRMNGAMYSQPGGHGVPTYWHDAQPQEDQGAAWGRPPASLDRSAQPMGLHAAPREYAHDPYDEMRARQNAQFQQDQQALAAQHSLLTSGPPPREALPSSFDPNRQDWPAYSREQYDTRQMDPPLESSQPSYTGPGRSSGQTLPQYDLSAQQPPQNYGRRW